MELVQLAIFAAGVGLLVVGAWALVEGGSRVAVVLGMPQVVVGLTVVAFGTSAPELFVSLVGALQGNTGLALGNVIGSNVANLGLILATAAVIGPVLVERELVRREIPLVVGVTLVFALLAWDGRLSRLDAGILVAGFAVFMAWTFGDQNRGVVVPTATPVVEVRPGNRRGVLVSGSALTLAGILGLAAGGDLIVKSAVAMAASLGISETVIGLTMVAVGTSLPELATTLMAAVRKQADIAMGNIVGSNLFNILGVAGPVGLVRPLSAEAGGRWSGSPLSASQMQLVGLVAMTLLAAGLIIGSGGRLGRLRGATLLAVYVIIMVVWTLS